MVLSLSGPGFHLGWGTEIPQAHGTHHPTKSATPVNTRMIIKWNSLIKKTKRVPGTWCLTGCEESEKAHQFSKYLLSASMSRKLWLTWWIQALTGKMSITSWELEFCLPHFGILDPSHCYYLDSIVSVLLIVSILWS